MKPNKLSIKLITRKNSCNNEATNGNSVELTAKIFLVFKVSTRYLWVFGMEKREIDDCIFTLRCECERLRTCNQVLHHFI